MTQEIPNQLATITKQNGLTVASANTVIEAFAPLYIEAQALVKSAATIEVTGADDAAGISIARAARLKLRAIRCDAENRRKGLKDESLRYGKAVDRVAGVVKELIEPVEAQLEEQEKIAERLEEFRKSELRVGREAALAPFGVDCRLYQLGDMPTDVYESLLATSKAQHEQRQEAARKAEAERVAAEAARVEEEKRIRAENERLRKEAAARDAAARAEREKLEAAARVEREARAKAEAELAAREKAEEAKALAEEKAEELRKRAEADAKRRAELAPDREKLLALADHFGEVGMPVVKSNEAQCLVAEICRRAAELAKFIRQEAGSL